MNFRTFLLIGQGVLLAAHCFLYFTAARFFRITSPGYRIALGCLLAFLSVSFLLASYVAHMQESPFTRAFYIFGGVWLGTSLSLLMAAIAAWLIVLPAGLAGYGIRRELVGGALLCLALAYSAYGVWNAFHPQVKNVQVTIKNLPESWKGRTIVQLSDVHLGHVFRAGFLKRIVGMVNSLHPDMVVITGDLFDGMDGALPELAGPLKDLHAPYGIYFVTGNHETYLGVDKVYPIMKEAGVTVLNDEVRELDGLQLAGISYPQRGQTKVAGNVLKSIPGFVPGRPTVLLYHAPVGIDAARAAGVSLQLSGHTHKGQIFPFGYITSKMYDGYDYGLHTIGDYSIYTSDGAGAWGPPMRTGNTPEIVDIQLD